MSLILYYPIDCFAATNSFTMISYILSQFFTLSDFFVEYLHFTTTMFDSKTRAIDNWWWCTFERNWKIITKMVRSRKMVCCIQLHWITITPFVLHILCPPNMIPFYFQRYFIASFIMCYHNIILPLHEKRLFRCVIGTIYPNVYACTQISEHKHTRTHTRIFFFSD